MPTALMVAMGLILPVPVYFGALPPIGSNMLDAARLGVDVAAGGDAHAALDDAAQVGDDVAEHVRGDDHVVVLGVLDHPHAAGVDVVVVGLDVGVLLGHLLERPPPEVVAEGQHVGLGDQRELLALGVVPLAGVLEGPADAAFAALAGVDGRLRGDLVGRALLAGSRRRRSTGPRCSRGRRRSRCRSGPCPASGVSTPGKSFTGPEVDVLVEVEPQVEQQLAFEDAGRDVGMADGAEQDGVELAQLVDGRRRAGSRPSSGSGRRRSRSRSVRSWMPSSLATALRTLTPSAATSGPVPSPPMTAILRDFGHDLVFFLLAVEPRKISS